MSHLEKNSDRPPAPDKRLNSSEENGEPKEKNRKFEPTSEANETIKEGRNVANNVENLDQLTHPVSGTAELTEKNLLRHALCWSCRSSYLDKTPILLGCLHVFCSKCILLHKHLRYNGSLTPIPPEDLKVDDDGKEVVIQWEAFNNHQSFQNFLAHDQKLKELKLFVKCPRCDCLSNAKAMKKNYFMPSKDIENGKAVEDASSSGNDGLDDVVTGCTGCEDESIKAESYCQICDENLCGECVFAHKRVKVTKEHKLVPLQGSKIKKRKPSLDIEYFKCEMHPTEQMKLFCDTCCLLTCRDCQLTIHKDHKYRFISEAAQSERQVLENFKKQFFNKRLTLASAIEEVDRTIQEDNKQSKLLCDNVQQFSDRLIATIQKKAAQIISKAKIHLEKTTEKATTELYLAKRLESAIDHSVHFIDMAVSDHNGFALLHSKSTVRETDDYFLDNSVL